MHASWNGHIDVVNSSPRAPRQRRGPNMQSALIRAADHSDDEDGRRRAGALRRRHHNDTVELAATVELLEQRDRHGNPRQALDHGADVNTCDAAGHHGADRSD